MKRFKFVFGLVLIVEIRAVTIPISQSSGRTFTVSSSSLLQELEANGSQDSSDNSYDGPLGSQNNSTLETASILNRIIGGGDHDHHRTVEYLGRVRNPGVVADELESASKYLKHQASVEGESGVGSGNGDLTRVLDGFTYLSNVYDGVVRPGSGGGAMGAPTEVSVDVIVHPWISVDEERNEMTVTVTLVQNWTDERLGYRKIVLKPERIQYVTLTSEIVDIWHVDSEVRNGKRVVKNEVAPVRITPEGGVSREQRMGVTVNCQLNNDNFPFDNPKCTIELASFSWNANQIRFKWSNTNSLTNTPLRSNGFKVKSIQKLEKLFQENRSGLVLEFQLERNLLPYVTKLYIPLGCFCLISILGLIGAGLSYFVFGLMSIFMGISFNGPHFNWGYARTRLDSYYLLCVLTVLLTGILNMLRLKSPKQNSSSNESYEMHTGEPTAKITSTNNHESRFWRDSDNFIDDEEDGGNVRQINQRSNYSEALKNFVRRFRTKLCLFCTRINDFSTSLVLGVFICWNLYYWVGSLRLE